MKNFPAQRPLIYLITEGRATAENFPETFVKILEIIRRAVEANIQLVQIREKKLPTELVYKIAVEAVKITRNTQTKILVNDRADVAVAANADGVHLTSRSLPTDVIRRNFPKKFIVGVSAHTLEEMHSAQTHGADFVTFSPIFKTPSKENYGAPQGLEKLREVCEKLGLFPVVALGGIDENNYKTVLKNGAGGFAAIRFLNDLFRRQDVEAQKILEEFKNGNEI